MAHYMLHPRAVIATFGHRVRARRIALGMSQPGLGRMARVTPKFIGQIERGESNPSLATMVLVADALGCELVDLIEPENAAPSIELGAEDAQRTQEAVAVIVRLLKPRRTKRANSQC